MRLTVAAAVSCLLLTSLSAAEYAAAAIRQETHIPPQSLDSALQTLAQDRNLQLVYATDEVGNLRSAGASGNLTASDALKQLLQGTGLSYQFLDDQTVTVAPMGATKPGAGGNTPNTGERLGTRDLQQGTQESSKPSKEGGPVRDRFRLAQEAQGAQGASTGPSPVDKDSDQQAFQKKPVELQEVVVTGTHLRSAEEAPPTVRAYSRDEIDRSGAGSVGSFLQKLPENFSGGASEATIGGVTGGGNSVNAVSATGVNLRGLGNDSTLVLLNGHRLAPGNTNGGFVDVSLIPTSALARVDVMTGGASAIYGSDAVAGVVNLILRRDFRGAESRARYALVDNGGHHQLVLGQTFGTGWNSGSALVSYEFLDQHPLSAADRSFTRDAPLPFTLLPEQRRHSVFVTAEQSINDKISLYADGTYGYRSTYYDVSQGDSRQHSPSDIHSLALTAGGTAHLPHDAELDVSASYSESRTRSEIFEVDVSDPIYNSTVDSKVLSMDAVLRGTLWNISSGDILYAAGGQYRSETFDSQDLTGAQERFAPSRDIVAEFVEIRVPLVGASTRIGGVDASILELTFADRQEHYSDFGSSNNPQASIIWKPARKLRVYGNIGKAFKAPLLSDLNPTVTGASALPLVDPGRGTGSCSPFGSGTNCTNTLIVFGGNSDLKPEKAITWTLGTEYGGEPIDLGLSYYATHYKSRITNPQDAFNLFNIYTLGAVISPLLTRNPSAILTRPFTSLPTFIDFSGGAPIESLFDSRVQNLSIVDTSGIDFRFGYKAPTPIADFEGGVDATYILTFDSKVTSFAPDVALLNTPYNPVRVKARGHVGLYRRRFGLTAFVNHIGSYEDPGVTPVRHISSWTTLDLTAGYDCRTCPGVLQGTSLNLSVQNAANKNPPFVENAAGFAINFDGANANALGRFFSLQVSKAW